MQAKCEQHQRFRSLVQNFYAVTETHLKTPIKYRFQETDLKIMS